MIARNATDTLELLERCVQRPQTEARKAYMLGRKGEVETWIAKLKQFYSHNPFSPAGKNSIRTARALQARLDKVFEGF